MTYHNSAARSGAYKVPGLTTAAAATVTKVTSFAPILSGHIYAQPLYWKPKGGAGELIVAHRKQPRLCAECHHRR
ncbi:MAG: hypothetical protein WDN04_22300, partial [Rhodospirillales bacterium]